MIFRTVEHQVFKEMGKSGAAWILIFGSYMIPDIYGHNRRFVVLMDDNPQSVIQHKLRIGNVNITGPR